MFKRLLLTAFLMLAPVVTLSQEVPLPPQSLSLAQVGNCNSDYNEVVRMLEDQYGEAMLFSGLSGFSQHSVVQVWANPDTQTFTIVEIDTNGLACLIFDGAQILGIAIQGEPM